MRSDKFTALYGLLSLPFFFLLYFRSELNRIFDLYILIIPLIVVFLLLVIIFTILMLIDIFFSISKRRWRRASSILIGPVLVTSLYSALGELNIDPQWVLFQLNQSHYLEEVASLPHTADAQNLKLWDWGETGGAGVGTCFYTLAYDRNDELTLLRNKRSAKWMQSAHLLGKENTKYIFENVENGVDGESIKKVGDHFYVVTTCF